MNKIVIDLDKIKRQTVDKEREEGLDEELLTEGDLEQFGAQIQLLLQRMFGMNSLPVEILGSKNDVKSFAEVMGREKKYIDKMNQYGLNDPKVIGDKYKLKQAIHRFERDTGINYPFKVKR
jgi:hypothetical protein